MASSTMNQAESYTPERIVDRLIIQDVLFKWCRAIDRLDFDAMKLLFHPEATDDHGAYSGDIEGMAAWIRERHKTISFAVHQLGNMLIEFASADVALVETAIFSIQRYTPEGRESLAQMAGGAAWKDGAGADTMGSARYIDRFERRHGEWRIAKRTVVLGWRRVFEVDAGVAAMPAGPNAQRRDAGDVIFRARAELGIV
jgi:hypothetical protein